VRPEPLRSVSDCNAVQVNSDAAFADDTNRLIAALPAEAGASEAGPLDALEFGEDEEAELQGLFTAGVALIDDHQYTAAIRVFERAVQLDPYDGEFWLRLGEAQWGAKRFDDAVAAFARCATLEPDNTLAWPFSAYVYAEQSRFDDLAAWDHVLEIDPTEWNALKSRGVPCAVWAEWQRRTRQNIRLKRCVDRISRTALDECDSIVTS
jgi:tetratricopeptide (TPR) repeat protein